MVGDQRRRGSLRSDLKLGCLCETLETSTSRIHSRPSGHAPGGPGLPRPLPRTHPVVSPFLLQEPLGRRCPVGSGEGSSAGCDQVQVTATCLEHQLCARPCDETFRCWGWSPAEGPECSLQVGVLRTGGLFLPLLMSEPQVGPSPSLSVQTGSQQRPPRGQLRTPSFLFRVTGARTRSAEVC